MINQKAISLKLDEDIYQMLEQEISLGIMKRNRLVNEAVKTYILMNDARRKFRAGIIDVRAYQTEISYLAANIGTRTI